jgi:competence protein CoiA
MNKRMKYALINGHKQEASPSLRGICQFCEAIVIAKCGKIKAWHWAHKSKKECDHWWENETEWHRDWKNLFPQDWQEIIHFDELGEKHIADVKTNRDWVIEFQHSYLKEEERNSRNTFYNKLVWVVDGRRRERDSKQFFSSIQDGQCLSNTPFVHEVDLDNSRLIKEWSSSKHPVFFDFGEESELWYLPPVVNNNWRYVYSFSRSDFVSLLKDSAIDQEDKFWGVLSGITSSLVSWHNNKLQRIKNQRRAMMRPRNRYKRRL